MRQLTIRNDDRGVWISACLAAPLVIQMIAMWLGWNGIYRLVSNGHLRPPFSSISDVGFTKGLWWR